MTRDFQALGRLTVVCDPYVPRTVELADGCRRPYGVRGRETVFVGPETYAELDGGSTDLVVLCLDCRSLLDDIPGPPPVAPGNHDTLALGSAVTMTKESHE